MQYTTVNNQVIEYDDLSPAEAAFLAKLEDLAIDDSVSPDEMRGIFYGVENPALDPHALPGHAVITKASLRDPVFRIGIDCLSRKEIRAGRIDLAQAHAAYTVDVPTAAEQLGVSPQAIRAGIDSFKYSALFAKGQWWLRPETVASLKLSREGGRLVKVPKPA